MTGNLLGDRSRNSGNSKAPNRERNSIEDSIPACGMWAWDHSPSINGSQTHKGTQVLRGF